MDIKEFSRRLGVSTTTISHALNGKRPVKPATRHLILEKMAEWGYTPNVNARRLVNSKTYMVAMFSEVPDTLSDPYQLQMTRSFCRQLRTRNYDLLLDLAHEGNESDPFVSLRARVGSHAIDGSVIIGHRVAPEEFATLAAPHCPCVFIDNVPHTALPNVGFISVDCSQAYRDAFQCLLRLDRRDIAILARDEGDAILAEWHGLIAEFGFRLRPDHCLFSAESPEEARDLALALLLRPPLPRAILARTDAQAHGALRAAQQLGIKVPEELSIISQGDIVYSLGSEPPLGTVSFDYQKLGVLAIDVLFDMMENPEKLQTPILFPGRFIPRGSVL